MKYFLSLLIIIILILGNISSVFAERIQNKITSIPAPHTTLTPIDLTYYNSSGSFLNRGDLLTVTQGTLFSTGYKDFIEIGNTSIKIKGYFTAAEDFNITLNIVARKLSATGAGVAIPLIIDNIKKGEIVYFENTFQNLTPNTTYHLFFRTLDSLNEGSTVVVKTIEDTQNPSGSAITTWNSDFLKESSAGDYFVFYGKVTMPENYTFSSAEKKVDFKIGTSVGSSMALVKSYPNVDGSFLVSQSLHSTTAFPLTPDQEYFIAFYDGTKVLYSQSIGKYTPAIGGTKITSEDDPEDIVDDEEDDTAPVNGVCGSVHGTTVAVIPTENLCTTTSVQPRPGWFWMCLGENGGAHVTCSAIEGTTPSKDEKMGENDPEKNEGITSGTSDFTKLGNPFGQLDSFPEIITAVINNIILPIAIPFIAVMIMYSGFLFVIARRQGSTIKIETAKSTLKYTLIGAVLTLGAFVIANALQGTLNALIQ